MTTLEKLSSLKEYFVGSTLFTEKDKRYIACSYCEAMNDYTKDFDWEENNYPKIPVLYSSTVEEVIDLAYNWEQENL